MLIPNVILILICDDETIEGHMYFSWKKNSPCHLYHKPLKTQHYISLLKAKIYFKVLK